MSDIYIINNNEKFTFGLGMIDSIKVNFETGVDQLKMPISGPMSNIGFDIDGIAKTITVNGNFVDSASSVITKEGVVENAWDIRDKSVMKLWFESILSGSQRPMEWSSPNDKLSARTHSNSTQMFDKISDKWVTLSGVFIQTRVFIIAFSADTEAGDVERIPFSMTLWVAGL